MRATVGARRRARRGREPVVRTPPGSRATVLHVHAPQRRGGLRAPDSRARASASASGVAGRDEDPRLAVRDEVWNATDAAPYHPAAAAERLHDNAAEPSERDGSTSTVASSSDLGRGRRLVPAHLLGKSMTRRSATSRSVPTDDAQCRLRHARRGEARRLGEHVDRLALEHADEARPDARGAARGDVARNGSRSINAAKVAVGSAPSRGRHPRCKWRSSGSSAFRNPRRASASARGRQELPQRRAVEPRRRRVAVDVRDHARRHPRRGGGRGGRAQSPARLAETASGRKSRSSPATRKGRSA